MLRYFVYLNNIIRYVLVSRLNSARKIDYIFIGVNQTFLAILVHVSVLDSICGSRTGLIIRKLFNLQHTRYEQSRTGICTEQKLTLTTNEYIRKLNAALLGCT